MFSFLKFLHPKSSDADKKNASNSHGAKTSNHNGPDVRALGAFNNQSPIARKPSEKYSPISPLRNNCKETVTSPGFSFRIAQRAREMRSTTPISDVSNLSVSYSLENSLNGSNTVNCNNVPPRDTYDKKRKLMETLDNFGVRKRTRQEFVVDTFVNRRRKTISESNASDRVAGISGYNPRITQPLSAVMNPKSINGENKKIKRHGDFGTNMSHILKKPRTRNNEILSSYSSSKFLLTPGQKRPRPIDHEDDESPSRKHCKSCTCCGSTVLLENDQNLKKSDKTTETDTSDNLVTVAASRIFNRSGKTQVVRKMCMKTILNEVFDDDIDSVPYTSIEKIVEKKKKALKKVISIEPSTGISANGDDSNHSVDAAASDTSTKITPTVTSTLSTTSSSVPLSSTSLITTSLTQSKASGPSESTPKQNEEISTPVQFSFGSPKVSTSLSTETNLKQPNELNGKMTTSQTPVSSNNVLVSKSTPNAAQSPNEQLKLQFQSPSERQKSDKDNSKLQFNVPASKPNEPVVNLSSDNNPKLVEDNLPVVPVLQFGNQNSNKDTSLHSQVQTSPKTSTFTFGAPKPDDKQSTPKNVMQFGVPKADDKQSTPVMQFGAPKADGKLPTPLMQFGSPKANDKQSTPVMQFGAPKVDNEQSTPVMQFGAPKADVKQSTPLIQFGAPKADDNQSTPVMQFGAPKADGKQPTPVMQFGSPKANDKQSTPVMQFGAPKADSKLTSPTAVFAAPKESVNSTSIPSVFSFGNTNKPSESTSSTEPVKFQFGSSKPANASSTEPNNVFGSNNIQSQNLFSFGKADNASIVNGNPPKYDATVEKSTPKLQFGALPTPVFGATNADQSKPQFSTPVSQSVDNQAPKLVFGSQTSENKPATSAPGMMFAANNPTNAVFQFNSSKLSDKPSDTANSSFSFAPSKTAPTFGAPTTQNFGDKPAFQFNAQKTEEPKTQFSAATTFGPQSATVAAPFKFGGSDKPASFGNNFSSNQPLQFTNNSEKPAEPFKFGSTAPASNTFQFSAANKTDNNPVKFGQASNTFSSPGFNGFGNNSTPQQTSSFGNVASSQPSPFGSMTSPSTAPAFGSVASPPTNSFGTNKGFQFGSTNNAPSSSSTFAFSNSVQSPKPDSTFGFNATPAASPPFQFGQAPASTPQFGGTQPQGAFSFGSPPTAAAMQGSSQPLFSMGTAPAGERRKAKAVRRRQ